MNRKLLWAVFAIGLVLAIAPFALPPFTLFTWFFLLPGVLLVLIAGYGLWTGRVEATHTAHHARPTPA